jgi:uncharacterized protein YhjY with autotransporter beta-barrel domain
MHIRQCSLRAAAKTAFAHCFLTTLALLLASPVQAGPDAPTTNNSVVFYQGNQSQGVSNFVSDTSPATVFVGNLNTSISPLDGTPGIQVLGSQPAQDLTLSVDSNAVINTSDAFGIHVQNVGGFDGTYETVTNSFTFITNVVNGTNVVTIITNFNSGSSNNYVTVSPAGGAIVTNHGTINTSGAGAHGIFAESEPGTINFTFNGTNTTSQSYGDAGPVTVVNSGNITTAGSGAHGILAQSQGGFGPEDDPTSGNGGAVNITTLGGTISTAGDSSLGIFAQSIGGDNTGGESGGAAGSGDNGGSGGDGGSVVVTGFGNISTSSNNSTAIFALSQAGDGGNGGNGGTLGGHGGDGGPGGKGGDVLINGNWNIVTFGTNSSGIVGQSLGGHGGNGGDGNGFFDPGGGNGGGTGDGGTVTIISSGNIQTHGADSLGIFARSLGGFAGSGGNAYNPFYANAGNGNSAGAGNDVTVVNSGNITTQGDESQAIYALSVGGGGGVGGDTGALAALGSEGGAGGNGSNVVVTNFGTLNTAGNDSHGIEAQSIGGGGGDGGSAGGLVALGGNGSEGSSGGTVKVYNTGAITTIGADADGILAQSIGGGGGNAGSTAGAGALGGTGSGGGNGAAVQVFNSGAFSATGSNSFGIFAQSIGGGGGNGGGGTGLVGIGGSGGIASQSDVVNVYNAGSILSEQSAIFAQSIGGGGGNGGDGSGWFAIGGYGGPGGNSGAVTVTNFGDLQTIGTNASALEAQSIGGGGGDGGNAAAVGAFVSLAIGGKGGAAGNGSSVNVTSGSNFLVTFGNNSYGIDAESIGGGGGNGGYAASGSVGKGFSAAIGIGGAGGGGGSASNVTVISDSGISTFGTNSHGLFAQSIGGGGGAGGFAVAVTGSEGASVSLAMGGNGGAGNNGGMVSVVNTGAIFTGGDHSYGLAAQSIGGGGGDGGFSISGAMSTGSSAALSFGGSGGAGGYSSNVYVFNTGPIATLGDDSHALLVQSVGGGGGSGGFSVAGTISGSGSLAASFGGAGGPGTSSADVSLINEGTLTTLGQRSDGILIQSVGGGGGDGGFSVSGSMSGGPSLGLSLGGSGGGGGNSGSVTLTNTGGISTQGDDSHGILAQSVGGGGGSGGFSVTASISKGGSGGLSIGGGGGSGSFADSVFVDNTGSITTAGNHSDGILAQSVGGGGGDGGFSVAGDIGEGTAATFTLGGAGGSGNYGSNVTVLNTGNITTGGTLSYGIFAQSLGGGGGDGGFSVSGQLTEGSSGASVAIGGDGGPGLDASAVILANSGNILTTNSGSHAIFAESVGGGGGAGGFAGSLVANAGDGTSISVAVGGKGGTGGDGGTVNLTNTGALETRADGASGIYAQSVGGGGGDGGFGLAAAIGTGNNSVKASVAIGGNGATGGTSSNVTVLNTGQIETFGTNADGIFAQSVGGGGGSGGMSASGDISAGTNASQVSVSVGGTGGGGNDAGRVFVTNTAAIMTHTNDSIGIVAQSIGGSGGDGGMAFTGTISGGSSKNASLAIGGGGNIGGNGNAVDLFTSGDIMTMGDSSHGILAQSVGGGGGNGGLSAALDLSTGSPGTTYQFAVTIGGSGGAGGVGGNVQVTGNNTIVTDGDDSYGIFAQSVGGGGGSGGFSLAATAVLGANQGTNRALTIAIGGGGGSGNDGGSVLVDRSGDIETLGDGSYGIIAQSVGGGGGDGGGARSFSLFTRGGGGEETNTSSKSINISVGGNGAGGGNGGAVNVTNAGNIVTMGADAYGIFAQSVGGGGGSGGNAHSSTDDLIPVDIPGINDLVNKAISTDADQYQVVVGGQGGASGGGSAVNVNQTGDITTMSDGSYGIFAQSVGGGGGVAGNGGIGEDSGSIGIGGSGGSSGDGSNVVVTMNGNIVTSGEGSAGILAQSVGGGGGVAGNMDRGLKDAGLNLGKGLAIGGNGGTAGNGGDVTVTNNGNITTTGDGAYGIFAQSVGGGGGLVGDLGNDVPGLSLLNFAGSVGGSGNGGDVTISQTGAITTYGTNSTGIFAQSSGGTNGVGGSIHVTVNGSVIVNGVDADGIFVQSGGGATVVTAPIPVTPFIVPQGLPVNGNADVFIGSNSIVQGGTGNSAGVRFMDGVNNTLENHGMISTLNGAAGLAVSGTDGNDTVENYGVVFGSVDLGGGGNAFVNQQGALFAAGSIINLGAGNQLGNAGMLALGDSGTIIQAALTGNYLQTSNGSVQFKLASAASYDALAVSGSAALDGNLSVFRFNDYLPVKGNEFTILTGSNVSGQFATLADPLATNYTLRLKVLYSATNVLLQVVQDSFLKFITSFNQQSLAQDLNAVSGVGTTNGDPRAAALVAFLNTQTAAQLPGDLDLIAPEEFGAMFDLDFASVNANIGSIQQRMQQIRAGNHGVTGSLASYNQHEQPLQLASPCQPTPMLARPDDDYGLFVSGNGQYLDVNGTSNAPGYHFHSGGVTLGIDKMASQNLALGATLDYDGTEASLVNNGIVDVQSGRGGLYGTWFKDNTYFEGSIGAGYNHYTTERTGLGGTASGATDGYEFDAMFGGGYQLKVGAWGFGPVGNIQYTLVEVNGFTESGSLAPLQLEDNFSRSLLTRVGESVSYTWQLTSVTLTPQLQLSWQHEFLDQDRSIDSQFASGAGNIFRVTSPEIGRDSLAVDAGFTAQFSPRVSGFLFYHGDLARENYIAATISGGLSFSF